MPSADRLDEFARIITEGSISAAARSLAIPRATVSRRLALLEEELGVRLVHRRTRSLVLTEAGQELFIWARRIASQTEKAWEAVRRRDDTPRGLLRVSVSEGIDPDLFLGFLEDYPEVSLVVRSTSKYVDLLEEGVDVAIRYGEVTDPDLFVRKVATVSTLLVATPSYLRDHGCPTRPEDLSGHSCIQRAFGDGVPAASWPLRSGGSVPVEGRLAANDLTLLHAAALRGKGLALLPRPTVAENLREGSLVALLEGIVGADFPVCLVHAEREYIAPKVRVFVDRAAIQLAARFEPYR